MEATQTEISGAAKVIAPHAEEHDAVNMVLLAMPDVDRPRAAIDLLVARTRLGTAVVGAAVSQLVGAGLMRFGEGTATGSQMVALTRAGRSAQMTAAKFEELRNRRRTIEPQRTVEHTECQAEPSQGRAYCSKCEKAVGGGQIVTAPPEEAFDRPCLISLRRFYCDFCNHVISWYEIYEPGTGLTGYAIKDSLDIITNPKKVREFLRKYPAATGVNQK